MALSESGFTPECRGCSQPHFKNNVFRSKSCDKAALCCSVLCDEDREQSDRRSAEPELFHPPPVKTTAFPEELSHYDTWSDPAEPYLFWYGLHFFPLSNELRKHRALVLGCGRCVGECCMHRLTANGKGMESGGRGEGGGARYPRIGAFPHPFMLSSFSFFFFLTPTTSSSLLKSCFQSSVPERRPNLGALGWSGRRRVEESEGVKRGGGGGGGGASWEQSETLHGGEETETLRLYCVF